MKKLLVPFLALLLLGIAQPVHAAEDTGWEIIDFHSDITLQADGKVKVEETIAVDFHDNAKHGIYRDIPETYTSERESVFTKIELQSALLDNQSTDVETSTEGSYIRFRLGEADTVIAGMHTYTLAYLVTGVLRSFDTYDELYWNVNGNAWPVTIESASATVHLPEKDTIQVDCYQGLSGSEEPCSITREQDSSSFASTRLLESREGLTIAVGYTKGLVPILTVDDPHLLPSAISVFLFIPTLLLGLWVRKRYLRKRNLIYLKKNARAIAPEYQPPANLRPGEVGTILDSSADMVDTSATIVDLAVRGFLTITKTGKGSYTLTRLEADPTKLLPYENLLLDKLFATPTVELDSLKKTFYKEIPPINDQLYNRLVEGGYFQSNPKKARDELRLIVGGWFIAGVVCIFTGWLIYMGIACIILACISLVDSFRTNITASGADLYYKVLGYKQFLGATEKYRQPFFEQQNYFMSVLPYAIVFGITKQLAEAFERMGYTPTQPNWLIGVPITHFNDLSAATTDFGKETKGAIAPPSSSGSGGGGFSGGGFGGGGGGSW